MDTQYDCIMMNPDEKKMSFIVRCKDSKDNIAKQFGDVEYTALIDGENAFTVKNISQNELTQSFLR